MAVGRKTKRFRYIESPLKKTQRQYQLDINQYQTDIGNLMTTFGEIGGPGAKPGVENLYADVTNPWAGMKNPYAGIQTQFENVQEDLTVAQKGFRERQRAFSSSQAATLQQMREMGMMGGGGAQAILNASVQQTAGMAADIEQQETANQRLAAQGAARVQELERGAELQVAKGAFDVEKLGREGEWKAEQSRIQGAVDARNMELSKVQGLMALQAGMMQSEQQAKQSSKSWFRRTYSDRRLKHNITLIKKSPSGLNIYNFEYKDSKYGIGVYQGVMSDEIPSSAVIKSTNNYDMVDYSKIDVDFIKIKD